MAASSTTSANVQEGHKFTITPSAFASFFYFNCERQLVFSAGHLDRIKWFYKKTGSENWTAFGAGESVELELAHLSGASGTVALSARNSIVDLKTRTEIPSSGEPFSVLRAIWYQTIFDSGAPLSATGKKTPRHVPLPESVSSLIEQAIAGTIKDQVITYDGKEWSFDLESKQLRSTVAGSKSFLLLARGRSEVDDTDVVGVALRDGGNKWEEVILDMLKASRHFVHIGQTTPTQTPPPATTPKPSSEAGTLALLASPAELQGSPHHPGLLPAATPTPTTPTESTSKVSDAKIPFSEFKELLVKIAPPSDGGRCFIYQPTLLATKELFIDLGIDIQRVAFSTCYPDFLEVIFHRNSEGKVIEREIVIVDAKATDAMKLSHRVQVGIYALLLDSLLATLPFNGQPPTRVSSTGGVWLRGEKDFRPFLLTPVKKYLRDFLTSGGKFSALTKPSTLKAVPWHLEKKCKFCSFLPFCTSQASQDGKQDFSLIYKMSKTEKQFLGEFLAADAHRTVGDIEDAHLLLQKYSLPEGSIVSLTSSSASIAAPPTEEKAGPTGASAVADLTNTLAQLDITEKAVEAKVEVSKLQRTASDVLASQMSQLSLEEADADSQGSTGSSSASSSATASQDDASHSDPFATPKKTVVGRALGAGEPSGPASPQTPGVPTTVLEALTPSSKSQDTPPSPFVEAKKKPKPKKPKVSSLSRDLWIIKQKIDSFATNRVLVLPRASTEMPSGEDLAIYLSVQVDRPNGHIYAWSISIVPEKNAIKDRIKKDLAIALAANASIQSKVEASGALFVHSALGEAMPTSDPRVHALETQFVATLYECTQFAATRLAQKDSTSVFIFSKSEAEVIQEILSTTAESHGLTAEIRQLSVHATVLVNTFFESPSSIFRGKQPNLEKGVSNRLVVVKRVLDKLFVLPLRYDADFADIHKALVVENSLPNTLGTDNGAPANTRQLLAGWYGGLPSTPAHLRNATPFQLADCLSMRHSMLADIVAGLRSSILKTNDLLLPVKPKPFAFRPGIHLHHPVLNKLTYLIQYEVIQSAKKKSEDRASLLSAIHASGEILEERLAVLRYKGQVKTHTPKLKKEKIVYKFKYNALSEVIRSDVQLQLDKGQSLKTWMLIFTTVDAVSSALQFNDFQKRVRPKQRFSFLPPQNLAFARVWSHKESAKELQLELSMNKVMPAMPEDSLCFLSPIEIDLVGDEAQEGLRRIDLLHKYKLVLTEVAENKAFVRWLAEVALGRSEAQALAVPDSDEGAVLQSIFEHLDLVRVVPGAATTPTKKRTAAKKTAAAPAAADDPALIDSYSDDTPSGHPATDAEALGQATAKLKIEPKDGDELVWECIALAALEVSQQHQTMDLPVTFLDRPTVWGRETPRGQEGPTTSVTQRVHELAGLASTKEDEEGQRILTPDQRAIFDSVVNQRLTCVWGPPGAGKTFFLGSMTALLAEAHRRRPETIVESLPPNTINPQLPGDVAVYEAGGAPFRVLVTAFTHSAIDNLVERILKQDAHMRKATVLGQHITKSPLAIGRLVNEGGADFTRFPTFPGEEPSLVEGAEESPTKKKPRRRPTFPDINPQVCYSEKPTEVEELMSTNAQCVVAGTVWAIRKVFKKIPQETRFHLILIDEASQLLLSHALLPLRFLLEDEGRIVIAGDHHQLPPIINAEYPDVPKGLPVLWGSVFEYVQSIDFTQECTKMLTKNWRMNSALTALPSRVIYKTNDPSTKYEPATPEIANRQFLLSRLPGDDKTQFALAIKDGFTRTLTIQTPLLQEIFDAEKAMTVILLKNSAAGPVGFPQAPFIACLTSAIRRLVQQAQPGTSDKRFWENSLLVVAPHHVQRYQIRNSLLQDSPWHYAWDQEVPPTIETVEKAQGREFDTVIADYGILDPFRIGRELRFLFNRNRINVAQTRARSKCVFFLAEELLDMRPAIFTTTKMQDGYAYLIELVEYAKKEKSFHAIEVDQIPALLAQFQADPLFSNI